MFCKKCGAEIRDTANFCPKCGTVCSMKTTNNTKKKQHSRIIALMTSLVLLLGACSGVLVFRKEILALLFGADDVYSVVDETLENTLANSEYQNAEISERKIIIQHTLEKMESDGEVKENSIKYADEDNYIYYEYINGAKGIITLENFSDHTIGESDDYLIDECTGENYDISKVDLLMEGEIYEEKDLSAIVLLGLGQANAENNIRKLQKSWSEDHLSTDIDDNVTVGKLMTELEGYNFIYILLHGNYKPEFFDTQLIFLNEKRSTKKDCTEYSEDFLKGNIIHNPTDTGTYYVITGNFFRDHYSNGKKLDNSIVFVGCCRGYCENDHLVSQFADCGAKAVIGATETVWTDYELRIINDFVYRLLCGDTVKNALDYAKSVSGKNELEFFNMFCYSDDVKEKFSNMDDYIKAKRINPEFRIYKNGGNATLVTLTDEAKKALNNASKKSSGSISGRVTDELGNPIKNAEVTVMATLSDTIANKKVKTDSNGYYQIACSPGNYKIKVTADGYEDYSSDEVINVENDFETMMDTIVLKKKEIIPEIVQAVLDNEALWLNPLNEISNYGYNECWFQDINMDGTPEFITGGNVQGAHAAHCFYIYHLENGELKPMENNYGSNEIDFWTGGSKDGYAGFVCQLYKDNNTGTYKYVYINEDGVATESYRMLLELSAAKTSGGKTVFNTLNILTITEKSDLTYSYTGTGNDAIDITKEEMLRLYDDYFKSLTAYETTVYAIPCSKVSADKPGYYDTMSLEDKKQTLLDSYNAWGYEENSYAELPLSNIIKNLNANEYSKTEMKTSESDLKEKANGIDNIIEWYCDDFDNDGNVEAFCLTGEKTDYGDEIEKLIFFNNESDFSLIDTSFWGVYAQCRVVEYKDIKYFIFDTHNGGSGSTTYVYYVVNNNYKEASCSGQIHGFVVDETGVYSFESGSGAHERPRINLRVDESSHDIIIE